jgi:hypothetical protein
MGGQEKENYYVQKKKKKNLVYCGCLLSRALVDRRNRLCTRLHRSARVASWRSVLSAVERQMVAMGGLDTTGIDCDVYQSKSGPVWFLAGTNGFDATRQCAIPVGRMIFFPIINWINDYPCPDPQFQPGPKQSLEQFLTIGYGPYIGARQYADHVTAASASLDGVAVQDLLLPPETSKYRVTSSIFNFNGDPSLQVLDPCVGPKHKGVSDGYWIMLKPLPAGPHTLTFSGTQTWPSGPPFTVTVTYYLTIY